MDDVSEESTVNSPIAHLDLERAQRRGYGEAILCEPKTIAQLTTIAAEIAHQRVPTLFTRVQEEQLPALLEVLPDAHWDAQARLAAWPPILPNPTGALVAVFSAGTADYPIANEAELTARYLGRRTELVVCVVVAGVHRILEQEEVMQSARAIVVAAGMDGALASVVAGLVSAPVVAVPTSVGYGAAFSGLAPLLSMLNACAPGVAVVNIDNGYGAGHMAAQIAACTD